MVVSEIRLKVVHKINLGNYESVEIEGGVVVGKNDDDDTSDSMRDRALAEVELLIQQARSDHLPERRRRGD